MNIHDFIFSKRPFIRYLRHIMFWTARLSYWLFLMNSSRRMYRPSFLDNWMNILRIALRLTIIEILITYTIVYWLYPVFLKRKKYFSFTVLTIIFLSIIFYVMYLDSRIMHPVYLPHPFFIFWFRLLNFTGSTLTATIVFIAIRIYINHYEKLEDQETLIQEKAVVEFQLLKAQVHPHFLFNTLNNIYSFALNRSPKAGELLSQLSGLMRYMIDECETDQIPLDRELKMLTDYISLEKVRYGDRLNIQVEIKGDYSNRKIAPLLMIPFVENCFKHGTSQMLEQPWVKLQIFTKEDILDFQLSNSRPGSGSKTNGKNGIGLKNIQKRLELLYPAKYKLDIHSTSDTFSVHMIVPLDTDKTPGEDHLPTYDKYIANQHSPEKSIDIWLSSRK
jgi:two-component system, LytTR family, sensor kinase